jgi:hypothetical protein
MADALGVHVDGFQGMIGKVIRQTPWGTEKGSPV